MGNHESYFLCLIAYNASVSRRALQLSFLAFMEFLRSFRMYCKCLAIRVLRLIYSTKTQTITRLDLVTRHVDFIPDMYFPHGKTILSQARCLIVWQ